MSLYFCHPRPVDSYVATLEDLVGGIQVKIREMVRNLGETALGPREQAQAAIKEAEARRSKTPNPHPE
jgi:hypothetical protein